jgi:amino acid transporter
MKRSLTVWSLLLASISAILGSGWLFTTLYTAQLAGPASILSWIIGGAAVIIVAFVFAELSAMLPVTGSSIRIPLFTHGTVVSFMFSWAIWLSYMALVPTEVQAIIQYFSYFFPNLVYQGGGLTHMGYVVAVIMMLFISALNTYSLRWLMRANSFLTVLKVLIPIGLVIAIFFYFFRHGGDGQTALSMMASKLTPFNPLGWKGILSSLAVGGILFAFNGFKQACEMAGEAKRPAVAMPIAVVGSVAISLLVYLLLQFAFLFSLSHDNLLQGWHELFATSGNSPFVSVLHQDHLSYLTPILYAGAVIGPLAAGMMYMGSASRSLYGMSKNQQIAGVFLRLNTQQNPVYAILLNFILGLVMFAPLPGWNAMIVFLTSLMATTYGLGPICLLALRKRKPDQYRPFKLPFPTIWAFLAFYICTLLTYWSGWGIVSKMCAAMFLGLLVMLGNYYFRSKTYRQTHPLNWQASLWVWPYFIGIGVFSYLGTFGGGIGILGFGWDLVYIAVFCVLILFLAVRYCLKAPAIDEYIKDLDLPTKPVLSH